MSHVRNPIEKRMTFVQEILFVVWKTDVGNTCFFHFLKMGSLGDFFQSFSSLQGESVVWGKRYAELSVLYKMDYV